MLISKIDGLKSIEITCLLPWSVRLRHLSYENEAVDFKCHELAITVSPLRTLSGTPAVSRIYARSPVAVLRPADMAKPPAKTQQSPDVSEQPSPRLPRFSLKDLTISGMSITVINDAGMVRTGLVDLSLSVFSPGGTLEDVDMEFSLVTDSPAAVASDLYANDSLDLDVSCFFQKDGGLFDLDLSAEIPREDIMGGASFKAEIKGDMSSRVVNIDKISLSGDDIPVALCRGSLRYDEDYALSEYNVRELRADMDIGRLLRLAERFTGSKYPLKTSGRIVIKGSAEDDSVSGSLRLSGLDLNAFGAEVSGAAEITLNGRLSDAAISVACDFPRVAYKKTNMEFNDIRLRCALRLRGMKEVYGIVLDDFSFNSFGGSLSISGRSETLNKIDYNLVLEDMTFLNYFGIPLYAKFNGIMSFKGDTDTSLALSTSLSATNIDFRAGGNTIASKYLNLSGNVIVEPARGFLYFDDMRLESGRNSRFVLNGYLDDFGKKTVDLTLTDSQIDLNEMKKIYSGLDDAAIEGIIHFDLEASGDLSDIRIRSDNRMTGVTFSYPAYGIDVKGINGGLWLEGNDKSFNAVFDCTVEDGTYDDISFRGLSVSIPYRFNPEKDNINAKNSSHRISIETFRMKNYIFRNFESELSAYDKVISLSDISVAFQEGQIGGDVFADIDAKKYSISLNAIDVNMRKGTGKKGRSLVSFVTRMESLNNEISGFCDFTRIDKDVVDKALLSLDPDSKNPQIKGMRSKLNMVGVVPKNIIVRVDNGFVDIIPKFTFRRSNVVSFLLGFIIGKVEVEPIRRIPLQAILKEKDLGL